jgi:hypothetical protein
MPKHITIGLLEASKTSRQTFARNLQDLSKQYGSTKKIIIYVKDEGANLNTVTITLKLIVSCEAFRCDENFSSYILTSFREGMVNLKYVFY